MPGFIPEIPTDASGAPEVNFWLGDTQEPTLAERIAGHEPYPAAPPAYDVENYARHVQYLANLRVLAGALYAERGASIVTIAGVTVGNQRRLTVNGTAVNYSDTGSDTLTTVTQAFVDAINANATITAGAGAAGAVFIAAGQLGVYAAQPGSNSLTVVAAVIAGAGTISASAVTTPSIVVPPQLLDSIAAYVLGTSPDDDGPDNDVRLVLDRLTGAFRAGSVSATQWDTRAAGSIGIGIQAVPVADDAIAIGTGSDATAVADIAIGLNSAANSGGGGNDHATAIGTATATGEAATAVGFGAAATAATTVAMGSSAAASAVDAIAVGTGSIASTASSVAVGDAAQASGGASAIAIGNTAAAAAANAIAIGSGSGAGSAGSIGIGLIASASAVQAIAIGDTAEASAASAIAVGTQVIASGDGALSTGHAAAAGNLTASGDGSRAHGLGGATVYGVTASGAGADAMGRGVTASGAYSRATGFGTTAGNRGEVAHASLGITDIAGPSVEAATHQAGKVIVQCRTAASTTRRMRTDAIDQTTGTTWTPMDDRGYYVKIKAVGKSESSGATEVYTGEGVVAVDAGTAVKDAGLTMALVASLGGGFTTASIAVAVSGGGLNLDATVGAGLDVRWTAEIEYVQAGITY